MAVIHILDKHTAELIAAGEVVERPASAVKELLENAIDAGAHKVTVSIEGGGVHFIEVSDDGTGIETEYIPAAFIRHATSKIATEADLEHIDTLGFRGEALASIASVARVELLTRTEADEFACLYRNEGGEEFPIEPGARAVGTTIRVRDLFYNTPARMKFLKKDASEGTFAAEAVCHTALSHPEVSVRFVREGKTEYVTPGDGKLQNTVYAVLGREFSRDLIPVAGDSGRYAVSGLITPPRGCRASRGMQYFFINGRYVKNRTIMAALETAFKGTTMQGKFPGAVLQVQMPPELVDVNVHPAKTEVRFAHENEVFDAVYQAVKTALAQPGTGEQHFLFAGESEEAVQPALQSGETVPEKGNSFTGLSAVVAAQSEPGAVPSKAEADILPVPLPETAAPQHDGAGGRILFDSPAQRRHFTAAWADERSLDIRPEDAAAGDADAQPGTGPNACAPADGSLPASGTAKTIPAGAGSAAAAENPAGAETAGPAKQADAAQAAAPEAPESSDQIGAQQTTFLEEPDEEPLQYVGEIFHTYIIAERGDEVCLIDKHAAHERILYEQLAKNYGQVPGQTLLAPVIVNVTAEEKQALLEHSDLLQAAGMSIEDFGGRTVAVREVPSDVEPSDVEALATEIAAKLARGSRDALSGQTEWVLHSIACRAAIKAGDRTPARELMALAEESFPAGCRRSARTGGRAC